MDTVWGGEIPWEIQRFLIYTDVEDLEAVDKKLLPYAVRLEEAYLRAYAEEGVISFDTAVKGVETLKSLLNREVDLRGYEDIHSLLEDTLSREIDYPYLCRSRNESIIAIEKLYLIDTYREVNKDLEAFLHRIQDLLGKHGDKVVPVYTHYRLAGLTRYKTYLHSYLQDLSIIIERINNLHSLLLKSPLGSAAVNGCPFTMKVAEKASRYLGFREVHVTGLEAMQSRRMQHIQHIEIVSSLLTLFTRILMDNELLWREGVATHPYTTGSSLLAHKKNPDLLEVMKAKAYRVASEAIWMKQLLAEPSGYIRSFQESKQAMIYWSLVLEMAIKAITKYLEGLEIIDWRGGDPAHATWIAQEIALKSGRSYRAIYKRMKELLDIGYSPPEAGEKVALENRLEPSELHTLRGDYRYVEEVDDEYIHREILRLTKLLKHMGKGSS